MAITNITQKTNLPIHDSKYSELSVDDKQRQFFSNYYTQVDSVDPALFDLVRGFLVGKNFDESTVDNLAISLLEVAKEQDVTVLGSHMTTLRNTKQALCGKSFEK